MRATALTTTANRRSGMGSTIKRVCVILSCCAFAGGMAACGSDDDSDTGTSASGSTGATTTAAGKEAPKAVAFLDESITTYTKPMLAGMEEVATKNGIDLDHFSADHDPQKQLKQCQDALATGKYQGFIIYAADGAAMQSCVKEALNDDVVVVPVNQAIGPVQDSNDIQVDGIKVQILNWLQEDVQNTVKLVDMACKTKPKPCRIVKTVAVPPYYYSSYKLKKEIPIYKDHGYEVVATPVIGAFDDPDGMINAINDVLARTNDIDVIVSDDDSSVQGAVQMKKDGDLPKDTLIIGNGGSKAGLTAVQNGDQFGTIYNVPKTMGARSLEELIKVYKGEPIENPTLTMGDLTDSLAVTKETAQGLVPEW